MSALQSILNSPVVNALGWTLVHSLWQGVAAAMLLLIAMRLMRSRSAQARYLIASAALVILLIAAAITLTLLFHDAVTPRISASLPSMVTASHLVSMEPIAAPPMSSTPSALSFSERFKPLLPWLTLGWMLGVLAIGTCHTAGWLMIRRVRRTGLPVMDNRAQSAFDELIERLNMSRGIRLTQSALVQVPTVVGWLWPIVLLPAGALSGLTPLELRGLLAHELAHIRRRDYLANLVQTAIETLLFYHPAAWWIGRVIRQERENCCDDFAAELCNRKTYAAALANMESLRQSPPLAVSARGGMLLPRIRRILGLPDAPGRRSIWSALAAILTVAAIAVAPIILNACSSTAHSAEKSAGPTTNAVTSDDLKPTEGDYKIGKNDLIKYRIVDPGMDPTFVESYQRRVDNDGNLLLKMVGQIHIAGCTEAEAIQAIIAAYGKFQQTPQVTLSVVEARSRVFTALGAISKPGEYEIPKKDFRLLDALALVGGEDSNLKTLNILRFQSGVPSKSPEPTINVPLDALRAGDMRYNMVILPGDLLIAHTDTDMPTTQPTQTTITVSAIGNTAESAAAARDDAVKAYQQAIAQQRAEVEAELAKLQAQYSNSNPQVLDVQKQLEAINARLAEVDAANAAAKKEGPAVYYISGVKRSGVYSISPQGITLKQALVAAGGADQPESKSVTVIPHGSSGRWDLKKIYALQDVLNDKAASVQIQRDDVLMVAASPEVPRAEYNISGNIPRPGVYSLADRQVNLLQALIAAGANPQEMLDKNVLLTRRTEDREREQIFTIRQILKEDGGMTLVAGDRVAVEAPLGPAHAVRIVIGENQLTLQGQPETLVMLHARLIRVPDRANTVLEIATASDKITVGRTQQVRAAIGDDIGFKYISDIGVHPLGSKASDESPATQPASSLQEGEFIISGRVKQPGAYSLKGREVHLTKAIEDAGGFDDPKIGDDALVFLRRKGEGGKENLSFRPWRDLAKPENDPVLQPGDIVDVDSRLAKTPPAAP